MTQPVRVDSNHVMNPLPSYLEPDRKERSLLSCCEEADAALIKWGVWWQVHQDRGFGLGVPSVNVIERINQPSAGDVWDLPPLPFEVEKVDEVVRACPPELRVVAWRWYVSFDRTNPKACARQVGRDLGRSLGRTLLKVWRDLLLIRVVEKEMI